MKLPNGKYYYFLILMLITAGSVYSQVSQEWVQRFTSDSARDENVSDMFVDQQGNVYITGSQKGGNPNPATIEAVTIKYNSSGTQQWIQNYRAPAYDGALGRAIYADASGNVHITGDNAIYGSGGREMLVVKYSSSGIQLWSYRFQYIAASPCQGYDIITDASGNVYVTGEYYVNPTLLNNIFLAKFSPSGALIGQAFINVESEGARKIAVDGAGKIIIAGYCNINQTDSNRFIAAKYEPNLDFIWATRFGSSGTGDPSTPFDMTVDINSNILCTGQNNMDYAVFKINSDGTLAWNKFYNSSSDKPRAIASDNQGNVFVTGETGSAGFPFTFAMTTVKYDPNGNEQWVRKYNGGSSPDGYYGYDIAVDNSSNVYITGNNYSQADIVTVKYNSAGTFQWVKTYSSPGANCYDIGLSVGVDPNGNTYTAGNSLDVNSGTGYDISVIKYSPLSVFGTKFSRTALNKPINDNQNSYDTINVDFSSVVNYYVYDVNLNLDSVIHTNDSDLEFYLIHNGITDTVVYRAGSTGDNFINTVLNDSAVNPISGWTAPFTGSFRPSRVLSGFNNTNINGAWILKVYDRATGNTGTLKAWSLDFVIGINPIGIIPVSNNIPDAFYLGQNYPNPFNPVTSISFRLPETGFVKLTVFDMLGREVETLVNENLIAGEYKAVWNAAGYSSGVYLYKLKGEGFSETKKMILVK